VDGQVALDGDVSLELAERAGHRLGQLVTFGVHPIERRRAAA